MEFKFKKKIGEIEIEITDNANSHADLVEKMTFFSALPTEGPNGEKDLEFRARVVKGTGTYYSLVCPSAKKELMLGQYRDPVGALYVKSWQDLYQTDDSRDDTASETPAFAKTPPKTNNAAAKPVAAKPAFASSPAPAAAPVAAPVETAAPKVENNAAPEDKEEVDNVLSRYGIKR